MTHPAMRGAAMERSISVRAVEDQPFLVADTVEMLEQLAAKARRVALVDRAGGLETGIVGEDDIGRDDAAFYIKLFGQ